jgi:hypothetical protein
MAASAFLTLQSVSQSRPEYYTIARATSCRTLDPARTFGFP